MTDHSPLVATAAAPAEPLPARQRWHRAACLLGLVALPWLAWPHESSLEGHHLLREAALAALAVLALAGWAPKPPRLDRLDSSLLAFALASCVSGALAVDPWTGLRLAGLTLAATTTFVVVRDLEPAWRWRGLGVVAATLAAAALGESLGWWPGLEVARGRAPAGPLATRNELAHVLVLSLAPWLAVARPQPQRRRILEWVALAVIAAGIVVTRSRAAWVALLAVVLLTAVLSVRAREVWPRLGAVLAGVACAAWLPTRLAWHSSRPYRDTWASLLDSEQGSGSGRLHQAFSSLPLVGEAPVLGVGPGHWAVHYPRIAAADDVTVDHDALEPVNRLLTSDVVAVWVERGLVGGALALMAAVALAWAWRRGQTSREIRVGAVSAAAALVVLATFDAVLSVAATLAPIVLALAPPRRGLEEHQPAWPRWPAFVLAAALGAVLVTRGADLVAFSRRTGERVSLEALERAAAASPGDYLSRAMLAQAHVERGACRAALPWLDDALRLRPSVRYLVRAREACRAAVSLELGGSR